MKYKPDLVMDYWEQMGLPRPVLEHRFHPVRKFRFDFAFVDHMVAVEVEGGIWVGGAHGRPVGIVRDMTKNNLAVSLGWRILRFQPRELCMADTVKLIDTTLHRAVMPFNV